MDGKENLLSKTAADSGWIGDDKMTKIPYTKESARKLWTEARDRYQRQLDSKRGRVMRIKTFSDAIIHVDKTKRSITIDGVQYDSDCHALLSDNKDGTGTITLVFTGKIL